MPPISRSSKYAFLAVSEVKDLGYCGGLLILGPSGRPIEFHCTAPVNANRAQQILYGATLKEFLVCDQIANSLLKKASCRPAVVLVDDLELTRIGNHSDIPVVWISDEESPADSGSTDQARQLEIDSQRIDVFGQRNLDEVESLLKLFVETLPLNEPFERIYCAINEAHKDAA